MLSEYGIGSLKKKYDLDWDGIIHLCDDTELYSDCLENLVYCIKNNFNDYDGVIGINQIYHNQEIKFLENGQCLIGKKFLNRFPNKAICCPDYIFWYQDMEVLEYEKSINKFIFCNSGKLYHWHPVYYDIEKDETHTISRGDIHQKDKLTYNKRKELGYLWGKDFYLVNYENN